MEVPLPKPVPKNNEQDRTGWGYKDKHNELGENRHAKIYSSAYV